VDKKTIAIIVLLALLIIFYWPIAQKLGLVKPPAEVAPAQTADTVKIADTTAVASPIRDSLSAVPGAMAQLVEVPADTVAVDTIVVQTAKYRVVMTTLGGGPVSIQLKDYTYRDGSPIELLPRSQRVSLETVVVVDSPLFLQPVPRRT